MPEFRRGAAAIEEAATSKGSGNFTPFVPEIFWKEDGDSKYVLVLTPIDEVTRVDLHDFIPIEMEKANGETYTRYESFASRKDDAIGEDFDKIEDELGRKSKIRIMGVAVELDATTETIKGRKRATGFTVKTDEFTRNTDDGEETVEYPKVGIISQSSQLMWSPLNGYDQSQGPLEDLPLQVTRRIPGGKASNTHYEFIPYVDVEVDLSPISELVDGISYLADSLEELLPELEATESDLEAAQVIARALMDRRLEELTDEDRYEELVGPIEELPSQPWEKKKAGKTSTTKKAARPARKAQRSSKRVKKKTEPEEEPSKEIESTSEPEAESEPDTEETKENKFARLKASLGDK